MHNDIKFRIQTIFNAAAEKYGRDKSSFFPYFGRRTVELANIPSESRVLDIGTGRGAILFPAVNKVGPKGEVIGIDISDEMVRLTGIEITHRRILNAHVLQMDAEHLVYPNNYFDFVLCGFAIFFFPNPKLAIKDFFRVLKDGGRLVVTTSGEPDPRWNWFGLLLDKYHKSETLVNPTITSSTLKEIVLDVGFSQVHIVKEKKTFIYKDEEAWWDSYMSHGGVRDAIFKMGKSLQYKFKRESMKYVRKMKQESDLHHNRTVLFTIGTK